jgi:hypothetical protein
MFSGFIVKCCESNVDKTGITCVVPKDYYTAENGVVFAVFKTWALIQLVLRDVYSPFYTVFFEVSNLVGWRFYTLSTGPITTTTNY